MWSPLECSVAAVAERFIGNACAIQGPQLYLLPEVTTTGLGIQVQKIETGPGLSAEEADATEDKGKH